MNNPTNQQSLKDVSLVIATFNEEESIKYVLDELRQYELGEIIIVDGNSSDNTKEIVKEYGIKFITQSKKGWGSAVKEGIELSTLPFVTYMDGDGSYNPKALLEMRNLIETNDAVFCSRYKDGAKSPDDTPIRAIGNKIFTLIVKVLFGPKITDALFFYPMFKKNILKNLDLDSDDFTLCLELPVKVHQMKLEYIEILSEERERYAGVTKVNAFTDGFKILLGILSMWKKI